MNNTAILFGVLFLAFVFFATARGDLPKWLGLFRSPSRAPANAANGVTQGPVSAPPALPSLATLPSLAGM